MFWIFCRHSQVEQVQHACECHVCNQDPSSSTLGPATCLPPSRLHAAPPPTVGHQFFTDSKTPPAHPALHLYPHIHGHLPLHNFSRPLLHPTLYPPSPPLTHSKVRRIIKALQWRMLTKCTYSTACKRTARGKELIHPPSCIVIHSFDCNVNDDHKGSEWTQSTYDDVD